MSAAAAGDLVLAQVKPSNLLERIESNLGAVAGALAAAIIVIESVLLGVGVFARYILHRPVFWSDELALILFAWLSMLGAVVALRRGAHMRLAFVVERAPAVWRERIGAFVWTTLACVLLVLVWASVDFTIHSWPEFTSALQWRLSFRTGSMAVGMSLMALTAIVQVTRLATLRSFLGSVAILALVGGVMWLARPLLASIGNYNLVFFFVIIVLVFIALGMEIAFAFVLATLAYLTLMTDAPPTIILNRLDAAISDIILLSIPMFIFVGVLLEVTGLAKALINVMISLLGHVRGGLHYVLLGGMYLVSGISGSKSADMAAIVPILFPEMKKRGEREGELVALLSVSGAMAETIPPSIILIAVGVAAGVSISDLFVGGLMPAVVGLVALAAVVWYRNRHRSMASFRKATWREVGKAFVIAIPALILPFIIRVSVVEGIATATEVATVGVIYATLCGLLIYRTFPLKRIYEALISTASLTGAILLVTGLAGGMAWALTQSGFSDDLVGLMNGLPGGALGFLLVSIVFFALLGSILEGFPAIVLFAPLMFPIAASFGVHGVHYAMVVVLSMSIGLFAPPFGVGFYAACAIGQVRPDKAMRDIWVYMAAFTVSVLVVALVPWFSIGFLPK